MPALDSGVTFSWPRLLASLIVAATTALLSVMLGSSFATLFTLTEFRGTALIGTLVLIPFVCPHAVWALTQVYCYGPGGLVERWLGDGMRPLLTSVNAGHHFSTVLVMTQVYTPLAMLLSWRGFERLHAAGWEAACQSLRPSSRVVWVIGALRAELAGVSFLIFALALGNFAVPHVLQCRLYVVDVYMRAANYLDHIGALVAAAPLIVVCVVAAGGVVAVDSRAASVDSEGSQPWRASLGVAMWPISIALIVYFALIVLLPIVALICECQSFSLFLAAVRGAVPETRNTLWLASIVAFGVTAASVSLRLMPRGIVYRCCSSVSFALLGIPSLIIALAYTRSFTQIDAMGWEAPRYFRVAVILALACRVWPYVARAASDARRREPRVWDEVAELSGLSTWNRWRVIILPTSYDYLVSGAIVAFVVAAGEIEICQMLCEPGQGSLTLRLFTFLHFGPTHVAASLSLLQLLLTCLPVLLYFLVCNRFLRVI